MQQKCKFSLSYSISSLVLNCKSVHVPKLGLAAFHPFYHIVSLNCNELICTEGERGEGGTCDCNLWYHQIGSIIGIFSVYLNLITTQTLFFRKSKNCSCKLTVSVKYRQHSRLAEMPSPPIFVLYWESVRFFVATKTRIMLLLVFMFYGKYTTGVWQPSP